MVSVPTDGCAILILEATDIKTRQGWGVQMAQAVESMAEAKLAKNRPRILVADGHSDMREYLTRVLNEHHYDVDVAADASTALSLALERAPDLIVADFMMRTSSDFA